MYKAMGIGRSDGAKRMEAMANNWRFFGAPCGMIITIPKEMNSPQWTDVGFFLATLSLLARERGLHCCFQEAWANYSATIREVLKVPDEDVVFAGVALGYADLGVAVNGFVTARAPLDEFATFHGDGFSRL